MLFDFDERLTDSRYYENNDMRRGKMKKIWKKPELVVLVRNRPEESVLTHCKAGVSPSNPSTQHNDTCFMPGSQQGGECDFCYPSGGS